MAAQVGEGLWRETARLSRFGKADRRSSPSVRPSPSLGLDANRDPTRQSEQSP